MRRLPELLKVNRGVLQLVGGHRVQQFQRHPQQLARVSFDKLLKQDDTGVLMSFLSPLAGERGISRSRVSSASAILRLPAFAGQRIIAA